MIAALAGTLRDREFQRDGSVLLIVDVNGVGYEVAVSARGARSLPAPPAKIDLAIYTHAREGAIALYGFEHRTERRLFLLLLGAHGVGPALALAILGALSEGELVHAIRSGDAKALTSVSGVGMKTAQRIILELAQRLDGLGEALGGVGGGERVDGGRRDEVAAALGALGYTSDEIRAVVRDLDGSSSTEELLRAALVQLAPR